MNNIKIKEIPQINGSYVCLGLSEPAGVTRQAEAAGCLIIFKINIHEHGRGLKHTAIIPRQVL